MIARRNIRSWFAAQLFLFVAIRSIALGQTPENPTGVTGVYNGNITTAGSYDPLTGNQVRVVDDLVVPGSVGAYPLKWTRYYNSNVIDGQWTFSYKDYGRRPGAGGSVTANSTPDGRILPSSPSDGKGVAEYTGVGPGWKQFTTYLSDGGQVKIADDSWVEEVDPGVYVQHSAYRATQLIDPYGQVTQMTYVTRGYYDTHHQVPIPVLDRVTEPGGRYLQLTWQDAPAPNSIEPNVISRVEAFDGRGNSLGAVDYYWIASPANNGTYPLLDHVNYSDGTSAHYTYATQQIPDGGGSGTHRNVPILYTLDDVRYDGPMRQIVYGTSAGTYFGPAHDAESNFNTHEVLSQSEFSGSDLHQVDHTWEVTYTKRRETRADSATREFTYSYICTFLHSQGESSSECEDATNGKLKAYTDFLGNTTTIGYDTNSTNRSVGYISTVTDPNGRMTTYTRATAQHNTWNVTRVDYPDGSFVEQTFTDDANPYYLSSRTAQRGPNDPAQTTNYVRDGNHRITRKNYPDGSFEEFTYNSFGQVLDHHMTSGGWEHFAYDARGLKTSYTDATGGVTTYSYYTSGPWTDRLQTITHPANASGFQATETYEYDHTFDSNGNETSTAAASRGLVTKITHTDSSYQSFGFNKYGDKLWEEDELRHRTSYVYDEYGRVLSVTTPPRYAGDSQNHTTANSYIFPGGTSTETTSKLPFATALPSGKQTTYDYDVNWRKRFVHAAPGTADAATTEYRYDEGTNNIGRLTTTVDPRGNATTYGYDSRDRQTSTTDALNHTTSCNFDLRGNKMSEVHANNELITYDQYDAMNRLLQKSTHRDAGTIDVVHMTYDLGGNLDTNTDENGSVYSYDYDAMNRPTQITYPNQKTEIHSYDAAGNVRTYTNRAGATQAFSYDNRNRQTTFTWTDGTSSQTSVYDVASRKTQIVNSDATINFVYYDDNKLKSQEEWATVAALSGDNVHRTVTYAYDPDGNRSTIQYPSGTKFDYDYTQRNQVADIKLDGQSSPIVSYAFDLSGNITARALDNGTSSAYTVDQVNRDTAIVSNLAGSVNKRFDYAYNSVNDITAVQRDSGKGDGYKYDLTQQITEFQQDGTVSLSAGTVANPAADNNMKFDGCGNRTQLNNVNQSFNNMNQPTGAGFDHDGNGNLKSSNGWSYTYDAQNRLRIATNASQGTTANFYYDGLNRQIARQISGGASSSPTPTPSATAIPTITPLPTIPPTPTIPPSPSIPPTPTIPPLGTPTPTVTPTPTPAPKCSPVNISQTFNNPSSHYVVSMSCPNPTDATIFYTTDGSTPTHNGSNATGSSTSVYSGPIDIGNCGDHPFKAIAYKSGWVDSDVSSQDYDHGTCGGGFGPMSAQSSTVTIFSVWDGDWAILEEYDASGAVVEKYLQGYHGLVKTIVANIYYYQDELGSTSHIANASGALLEYYKYNLYGKPKFFDALNYQLSTTNFGVADLGNGGARWIPQLGLYDDRNRFMSPDLGRFIQPDPIGFKGDASNLYRYCGNDWANRTDPMGTADETRQKNIVIENDRKDCWEGIEQDVLRSTVYAPTALSYDMKHGGEYHVGTGQKPLNLDKFTDRHIDAPPSSSVDLHGGGAILKPAGVSIHDNIKLIQQIKDPRKRALAFYNLVQNKGPWNYKRLFGRQYRDFGNYNYGVTGRAAGFPRQVLERMAGWYQERMPENYNSEWGHWYGTRAPYGDDPRDQYMIHQGMDYYDTGGR